MIAVISAVLFHTVKDKRSQNTGLFLLIVVQLKAEAMEREMVKQTPMDSEDFRDGHSRYGKPSS